MSNMILKIKALDERLSGSMDLIKHEADLTWVLQSYLYIQKTLRNRGKYYYDACAEMYSMFIDTTSEPLPFDELDDVKRYLERMHERKVAWLRQLERDLQAWRAMLTGLMSLVGWPAESKWTPALKTLFDAHKHVEVEMCLIEGMLYVDAYQWIDERHCAVILASVVNCVDLLFDAIDWNEHFNSRPVRRATITQLSGLNGMLDILDNHRDKCCVDLDEQESTDDA